MKTAPKGEGCREGLPGVSMSEAARYKTQSWDRAMRLGVLTDRQIERYQKQGKYGPRQLRLPETPLGRLVWSC
jgi:hypothetical protein